MPMRASTLLMRPPDGAGSGALGGLAKTIAAAEAAAATAFWKLATLSDEGSNSKEYRAGARLPTLVVSWETRSVTSFADSATANADFSGKATAMDTKSATVWAARTDISPASIDSWCR